MDPRELRDAHTFEALEAWALSFPYVHVPSQCADRYRTRIVRTRDHEDPILIFEYQGLDICYSDIRVGAVAAGMKLEEIITLGAEFITVFGGVGVLTPTIPRWTTILPNTAIRNEGTSLHYQTPSLYAYPCDIMVRAIRTALTDAADSFTEGGVWTSDAPHRETFTRRRGFMRRVAICVDMEV